MKDFNELAESWVNSVPVFMPTDMKHEVVMQKQAFVEGYKAAIENINIELRHIIGFYRSAAFCGEEIKRETDRELLDKMNAILTPNTPITKQ